MINVTGPLEHPHDRERQFKNPSRPRGRPHTAKPLLLCSLSCCHSLINHTHTHTIYPNKNVAFTSQRSSVCWVAAEPAAQPDARWNKAKHLENCAFLTGSVRAGPGADGAASCTVDPQHKSREQATQPSTSAAPGVGGEHITNGHTASGDGGRRRGR